jgi:lipopolysaccharide assembly outer membrane protein LptD (OstA)
LNYSLENERMDNGQLLHGSGGSLVSGARTRLSDTSSVYIEERYQDGTNLSGLTHATGINLTTKDHWNLGYGVDKMQFSSAVEYRRDNAEQTDQTHNETTAWVFRNNFKLQLTPDWRLIGKLDHSVSDSSLGEFYAGGYTEAVVGYAYRPVSNDRLNALVKYTYFYNVPTTDQVGMQNIATEFLQKSHIAALDLTYDLTANWSIGSKYAYRMGEASLDRVQPNFFDDAAQLEVLRVDWRFFKEWESLAEVRTLNLAEGSQRRSGVLTAIYHHLGKDLKGGVGYNFTNFSDDLTDLKYNHKGVFLNIVGTK